MTPVLCYTVRTLGLGHQWESRSLTLANTLFAPTHTESIWQRARRSQSDKPIPIFPRPTSWSFENLWCQNGNDSIFSQIHERLRQSIRGVLDPIYNPIKKLLKTDGKKSAQVREEGVSRRLHGVGFAKVVEQRGAAARHIPLTRLLLRCRGDNMPSCPIPSRGSRTLVLMWLVASAN